VDTYFDGTFDYYDIERLTHADEVKVLEVVTGLVPEVDLVVLLLNDGAYGGAGGVVPMVSANAQSIQILVHELGHSFANLADEYTDPFPDYPPGDDEPNVDFDATFADIKWNVWIDGGTPLPTPLAAATDAYHPVGAYEGARYLTTGIYRPAPHCLMQSLSYAYCDVCREALVRGMYLQVTPLDAALPAGTTATVDVAGSLAFSVPCRP
jgi:hypothetical protein